MKTRRPRVLLKYFAVISTICIFVLLLLLGFISLVDRARQIEWPWEVAVLSDPTVIPTNHYPMRVTAIRAPGTRWGGAGAIDAVGNQIFLATRSGGFFRYVRGKSGFERLEIPSPTNITALVKNFKENKFRTSFGLKDMLISDQSGKTTIYATYHIWKEAQKCYALRLSRYDFSGMGEVESKSKSSEWETLFETQPCVSAGQSNYPLEAGGRLSFLEDNILLMTVGDHDFKRSSFVQAVDTSYGKIWKINVRSGHSEIFSIGHRNPQGLFVSASGVIWETEHGPKGGDELNIIKKGANYGWPLRTYGTAYGKYIWSLSDKPGSHEDYERPLFTWTPAIGISNVLVIEGNEFPIWEGDLLVLSLRAASLFRVRVREGRVVFAEKIILGRKLRDILEMHDGTFVVLADSNSQGDLGEILILGNEFKDKMLSKDVNLTTTSQQKLVTDNQSALARCAVCHSFSKDMAHSIGPNLWGIIGRKVGAAPGYKYSAALSKKGIKWTEQNIRNYLSDPIRFAPGSTMPMQGVLSKEDMDAIVSALKLLQ